MDDPGSGEGKNWAVEYYHQQELVRSTQGCRTLLKPSVLGACLAVAGRILIGPLALLLLFCGTEYLSGGTVLIKADNSFFAFTENDLSMAGGCTGCLGPCKIVLLKYSLFNGSAFVNSPDFKAFVGLGPTESLYDFSVLSDEALALAEALDASGAICQSGNNEWGSATNVVTGTAQEVMNVIKMLNLSVAPQMMRELELGIEQAEKCVTKWNMIGITRLFQYPTTAGDAKFAKIPAVDLNVFPDYTECRPVVANDDSLVGSKLALATNGVDLLSKVPEILTLFPYSFTSSLAPVSRVVSASNTNYGASTVLEPLLRAYYGACRVRAVNTTGVYIEDTCEISNHWEIYGLMVHSPDDIPLCSTSGVCIHNYYNSLWEWVNYMTADRPDRIVISLYQVMSHKRSVLLTQIWAYRCQNGRMQIVYLAQISYHLIYNSDLYMLGLATGTLTGESIANLMCCFFAFSYSFINLVKARSGDQNLDRHFRLVWETMQLVITISVGATLLSVQRTPIVSIFSKNAEVLRKTSSRGAKYCGLSDSCVLFTHNMPSVVTVLSVMLGVAAILTSFFVKKLSPKVKSAVRSARMSLAGTYVTRSTRDIAGAKVIDASIKTKGPRKDHPAPNDQLTSFEENCLGAPFKRLFRDCEDMAYVMYNGKKMYHS
ncbi:hypothetical protein PR002_g20840 [Phytophthora rubi]|uniref:Uncharacterized protein n=1 Tax=Phytophthora rubi TaxID=129364 RepID=A0A6A3J854_9STRA|nr:hypothetical protein PR002_g20840 [Phytophthora rubi]